MMVRCTGAHCTVYGVLGAPRFGNGIVALIGWRAPNEVCVTM